MPVMQITLFIKPLSNYFVSHAAHRLFAAYVYCFVYLFLSGSRTFSFLFIFKPAELGINADYLIMFAEQPL